MTDSLPYRSPLGFFIPLTRQTLQARVCSGEMRPRRERPQAGRFLIFPLSMSWRDGEHAASQEPKRWIPRQKPKHRKLPLSTSPEMTYGIRSEDTMTRTLLPDEPFIKDCFTCRLEPVWRTWEKGFRGVCRHLRGDRKYIYSMSVRPLRSSSANAPSPRLCPLWQA